MPVSADPRTARCAHPPSAQSGLFCRANASRSTSAAAAAASTRQSRERMPNTRRHYADWTIERIRADAAAIGPSTASLTALILGRARLNRATRRAPASCAWRAITALRGSRRPATAASTSNARSYGSIQSILKHGLDRRPPPGRHWSSRARSPRRHPRPFLPINRLRRLTCPVHVHHRPASGAGPPWHGARLCRTRGKPDKRRPVACRMAGSACSVMKPPGGAGPTQTGPARYAWLRRQAADRGPTIHRAARSLDRPLFKP